MADSLESDYLQQNRQSEASQAGSELLMRMGLDSQGNPLAQPAQPGAQQVSAQQHAAGAAERIKKIRADQAREVQPSLMEDVVKPTGAEVWRSVAGGVTDAMREMLESADSLDRWVNKVTGTGVGGVFGKAAGMVPEVAPNESTAGQLARGVSQFATGFVAGGKGVKMIGTVGKTAKSLIAGAFSDVTAFDPDDPNISNMIQSVPGLQNPLTEFLATQPGDNEALNRFKRGIEGLGIGKAADMVVDLAKNLRARRGIKQVESAFEQAQAQPAALAPEQVSTPAAPPSAASQIDVVRPPESVDIPVGTTGREGVMQAERLMLPAPGQYTLTADELAENLIKERRARMALEGNPTLRAAQEATTIKSEVVGNPTLRAAYETTLRGESEEAIVDGLVKKAKPELEGIVKDSIQKPMPRAGGPGKTSTTTQAPKPEGGRLEEIVDLVKSADEDVYIRWSRGPQMENLASRDYVSGSGHSGLSAVKLEKEWSLTELANRLKEYGFLRMKDKDIRGHLYTGKKVGTDSDGYPVIEIKKHLGELGDDLTGELDTGLADRLKLTEEIADYEQRLTKITDSSAREIVEAKLRDAKSQLANLERPESFRPPRGGLLNQKGEVSPEALHAIARAAVGGAIGLTQGETLEQRIGNALLGAGVAAAAKPALIKKLIGAMEKVAPKQMKILRSFDAKERGLSSPRINSRVGKPALHIASEAEAKAFLAADPSAISVGKKAVKINWDEIDSEGALDDTIKKLTKLNEEDIDFARRGVQGDEKRRQLANMLGMSEDDMLRRREGQALNAEQTQAFIDIYGASVSELDRLAAALKAGENVEAQFRMQLGRTTALTKTVFGARAESGRALRVWSQAAQQITERAPLQQKIDMLTLGGKNIADVPAERLADMILALDDPAKKLTFVRQATETGKNAVLEVWMNGLLSNPVSHVANITSNAMTSGIAVIERAAAGFIGKEVARNEASAMLHGLASGWLDALKLAGKAFKEGTSQMGLSKLEGPHARAITAENFGLSGGIGRAVDLLGAAITTPGRALMAADDFFKGINYRMELHAQAARQATGEGIGGAALAKRIDELVRDSDFASLVKDQTDAFANYQTFNQPLGSLGTGVVQWLNEHPAARVVMPFVRTPVNIAKYTIERTPVVNLLMKQVRSDFAAGGLKRDMAMAKTFLGGMTYLAAGSLAYGGYITGGGPMNKQLRDLKRASGWQPYSFKIGDRYVAYSRFDPLGFMFGLAADMVEKGGELEEMDVDGLAVAGVLALKETMLNKTFMKGVSDVFEAITSQNAGFIESYFERLAGSVVPAGVANLTRQLDPVLKEVNSAADAIFARLPGYSATVPPRRNIWGEPIELEGALGPDMVSPLYSSTQKADPVTEEILRLEVPLTKAPNYIFGTRPTDNAFKEADPRQGLKLTPEEYDRFAELAGEGLKEKLGRMMQTPLYQNASVVDKRTLIQRYVNIQRDLAERQMMKEFPDLEAEVRERFGERAESHRPGTDTGASPFNF